MKIAIHFSGRGYLIAQASHKEFDFVIEGKCNVVRDAIANKNKTCQTMDYVVDLELVETPPTDSISTCR